MRTRMGRMKRMRADIEGSLIARGLLGDRLKIDDNGRAKKLLLYLPNINVYNDDFPAVCKFLSR